MQTLTPTLWAHPLSLIRYIKKIILSICLLFITTSCFGQTFEHTKKLNIREDDNSPSLYPYQVIVDNNTLTSVSGGSVASYSVVSLIGTASGWTDDGTVVRLTTATDKVGIGTASPSQMLDIEGAYAGIVLTTTTDVNHSLHFRNSVSGMDWQWYQLGSTDPNANGFTVEFYNGATYNRCLSITQAGNVVVGASDLGGIFYSYGGAIINESGANSDTRIEGDTEPNLLFIDASADAIGIGTPDPARRLHIFKEESAQTALLAFQIVNNNNSNGPGLNFWRSRGTNAVKTVPQSDDVLGAIYFQGWDGSAATDFFDGAQIRGQLDGIAGVGSMPGKLVFLTSPDGSVSAKTRMTIRNTGEILIPGNVSCDSRISGNTVSGNTVRGSIASFDMVQASSVTGNTVSGNTINVGGAYTLPIYKGASGDTVVLQTNGTSIWQVPAAGGGGSGDITSVGDVSSGAAFDGTQGTLLTFYESGGNATQGFDGRTFSLSEPLNITGNTVTANTPPVNITQTWNNSGVTFSGIYENITNTASGANSTLIHLLTGGTSRFSVTRGGSVNINTGPGCYGALGVAGGDIVFRNSGDTGSITIWDSTTGKITNLLQSDLSSGNSYSYAGAAAGELTASSGTQNFFNITPRINQTSTAGYNGILLNVTETATGSGSKYLLNLQIDGTSKFSVNNVGSVSADTVFSSMVSNNTVISSLGTFDRIQSSQITGNSVAINTTPSPSYKLNISGDTHHIGDIYMDNAKQVYFRNSADNAWWFGMSGWSDDKLYMGFEQGQVVLRCDSATELTVDTAGNTFGGGLVINENGNAHVSRIKGDTYANLVYVDGPNDKVGLNTSTPTALFDVSGNSVLGASVAATTTVKSLLVLNGITSDPPAAGSVEGTIWYRSDLDEYRVSANSVTYKLVITPV